MFQFRFLMIPSLVLAVMLAPLGAPPAKGATIDSFFDVFTELMEQGNILFESTAPTKYPAFDTEMISMSLRSSPGQPAQVTDLGTGQFQVDSFFDITYQIEPPDGRFRIDIFFDVFTELRFTPPPGDTTGTFQTEMISMSLSGDPAGASGNPQFPLSASEMVVQLDLPGLGAATLTDLGGGDFTVDSFFDVFTELSVDGGQPGTFREASAATRLDGSILPEPSSLTLIGVGLVGLLGYFRRQRTAKA